MKLSIKLLAALLILLSLSKLSFAQEEEAVEIMVMGRQPGPPLWQVLNGENVLWVFPSLSLIPKDMIWESEKVEKIISESQEAISIPSTRLKISKLVMFNPINIFRGMRLFKRISKNPAGDSLEQVLPAELYERFSVLKAEYFPSNDGIEEQRPLFAGGQMVGIIQSESDLVSGESIEKKIRRMIRRTRGISKTEIDVEMKVDGNFTSLANRVEALLASFSKEQELACFESEVTRMEEDLDEAKYRANAWARGYIDEFRFVTLAGSEEDDCFNLILSSSELSTIEDLRAQVNSEWMQAAQRALETNASTFAVLSITELLKEGGFIDQLRAEGYEVIEP